jgi:hypothetical protein
MEWILVLSVVCSIAGLILVIGSLLLLWRGRIFLDAKGKDVSHVELPMGIKLDTHAPVLIMFLFGVFMLVFPVYYNRNSCPNPALHNKAFPEMVKVTAPIKSPRPVDVYAIVAEQDKIRNQATFNIPFGKDIQYRLIYGDGGGNFSFSDPFSLGDTPQPLELRSMEVQTNNPPLASPAAPATVDPSKIAEFK